MSGKTNSSYFPRASTSEPSTSGIKKETAKEKDGSSTWRTSSAEGNMQCYNSKSMGHLRKIVQVHIERLNAFYVNR